MSFEDDFGDLLNAELVISAPGEGTPDPVTGAATLQISEIWRAPCNIQAPTIRASTQIALNAGVPLDLPAFRVFTEWRKLPAGALVFQVDGLTYPLKRPPIDVGGAHEVMELDLGPAEPRIEFS